MKNFYSTFGKVLLVFLLTLGSIITNAQSSVSLLPNITGKCPGDLVYVPVYITGTDVNNVTLFLTLDKTVLTNPAGAGQPLATNFRAGWSVSGFSNWNWNATIEYIDLNFTFGVGDNLANTKICDLVYVYNGGVTGTTTIHLRNSPEAYPVCDILDPFGTQLTPYTFSDVTVSGHLPVAAAGAIAGVTPVCQGQSGVAYSVAPIANATGYNWTLPAGATIAAGANTNSITVNFSTIAASGNVTVAGTNACGSGPSSSFAVTVNPIPTPTITGLTSVCVGTNGVVYTTEAGMAGYNWTVSGGGTITGGNGTNAITVNWNATGAQFLTVTYTNAFGCSPLAPTITGITVNPLPTPTITGPTPVCEASTGNLYTTEGGMAGYTWNVTGGVITSGAGTNQITVTWNVVGAQTVSVNYTIPGTGCTAVAPTVKNIQVDPNATIILTSAPGTNNQTLCVNNPIIPITYSIGGGGTGAGVVGLPAGVTGTFLFGNFTILGTPTVSGTFNYTVTTTGICTQVAANGTITVNPDATIALTSGAGTDNQSLCINTPITNITYSVGGGGTGAGVVGLPAGVSGNFAAGLFTISGTPTVNGVFNYTVTTTGTCIQAMANGTITVNPDATITLTSAPGSNVQNLCINTPITNITYAIGGGGTGAGVVGLPAGVTSNFAAGVFTISGTPTAAGIFNYTVTTTGTCAQVTAMGTITVNPDATITLTSGNNNQTLCINTPITNITYTVGGGGTGAGVVGLPAGVTGNYALGVFTISGTPTVSGTFPYTVTTTGTCVQATATGTIIVNPDATITLTSGNNIQTLCINNAIVPITYIVGGSGTGAGVVGLPAGVTGNFAAGIFTISGTPTVSGIYNYTVTTTGICAAAVATGTITVNPDASIALTSGNNIQTVCINTPIANITYTIGGGGTGANVAGLPAGVTGNFAAGIFTISGTPSVSGVFNYTVTTTGTCVQTSANGTITVNPDATITLTSAPGTNNQALCINNPITTITYSVGGGATGAGVVGLPAGVTGNFAAGVFTISGTPTVSGVFNYVVTTTGVCVQASANGIITVNPDATITLTSAPGTNNQSLCINTAITNITYAIGGGGTGAGVAGLPAGVTGNFAAGVFTISGTPTVSGVFNYTVTTTGTCVQTSANGTITVNPDATITLTSAPGTNNQSLCINTAINLIVYAVGGTGTGAGVVGLPAGVTGHYLLGDFYISGTPTVSGTFNYTVTATGTCASATATGTITVNPDATIVLTSALGTDNQSLCINTAITNITYAVGGGGTGAGVVGLPAGVSGSYLAGVFTISGTPTVSGTYNYTVTTTGTCVQALANGTITVNPDATIALTSGNNTQTVCINTPIAAITYNVGGGGTGAGVVGLPAGVTGNFAAGVFTISGTPTTSGIFNYTVTTTGTCVQATATGTITVNPDATIVLTSAIGTDNQSLCINTALTPITYAVGGTGTGAGVVGLPAGVTGAYLAGVFTISGTPTVSGTFNYTVTTTGICAAAVANGTITVNPDATITLTSGNNTQTVCINTPIAAITYNVGGGGTGAGVAGLPAGVTGNFAAGVFTINGTPTVSGVFNYTVTTTGTCVQATATGTITVDPDATITLTTGNNIQSLCINTPIAPIIYSVGGTGTGAGVVGLPAGVTGSFAAGLFTISGTPTVTGTFNYTVTTTGICAAATATGTITVNPDATIALTSGNNNQTLCVFSPIANIIYTVGGGGTGAGVVGLPAGVNGTFLAGVFTISGTPTVSGVFNYTVTTTGTCVQATATGTLTVNPLPVPTLAGPSPVCVNSIGNTYTTEAGMTNYVWTVSAGGLITAGGGAIHNTVTVNWITPGPQSVSVNYTDGNGCMAAAPTVFPVTVNPLPVPTIVGPTPVCVTSTGNIYQTEVGMSNYFWIISAGGTITAGGGVNDNTVTVTWNTTGAQTVSVNYTNANNCTAAAATVYNVTVNPLPIPVITGPNPVCVASTGNVYQTQPGMTNYTWNVVGGTITAGGTLASPTVTVTWDLVGVQSVSVSYTNANGCTAATPTVYNVTVNPLPVPTIVGPNSICATSTGVIYTTEPGMLAYLWNISAGGTITAGAGTNQITVTWNTAGAQNVSVNYTNINGCTAATATVYNVTVNPLPVPTINGPASLCDLTTGSYTTEAGMSGYNWTVSAGGTITAGAGTPAITVDWNGVGAQIVAVSYTDGNGCTAATPTVYNVTVNPLPVPTIAGPNSICINTAGNVYTTEAGLTNYVWTVSPGGIITAGGTAIDNTVTVTWTAAGPQSISVNYTNAFGCVATTPTIYNVTVHPTPVPTITGPTLVCFNSSINYTTEAGMSNYVWNVSAGGTVTAGGTAVDDFVTVTWNTVGPQTVSVGYTSMFGCPYIVPTVANITVAPLPTPTIAGPTPVCAATGGNVYVTELFMTNYVWNISAGGTVTAGGTATSNTITVTWNTAGPQTVSVNYTDANGCSAASPTVYNVTVNALPVPTIAGPASICINASGNYSTENLMSGYVWNVVGGNIIAGAGTSTITVLWNTVGAGNVSVSYTDGNGCTAATPTIYNVTVNPLPVPTIAGPANICQNTTGNVYTTEAGMTNYNWTVSFGGLVTAGGGVGDDFVIVTWNVVGAQTVSVGYTNANGCISAAPTVYPVNVLPLPTPTISGPNVLCANTAGLVYTTEVGMTNYVWTVSAGGVITAGAGTDVITVTWNTAGAQTVSVTYTNTFGCNPTVPTVYNVTVNPLPVPTIAGPASVCATSMGNVYTTESGMTGYVWNISAGGTITAGAGTNAITVSWNTAGAQFVSVSYTNTLGCVAAAPTVYNVTVNPLPVPTIAGPASVCVTSTGNVYSTELGMTGYTWAVSAGGTITAGGTAADNTITVTWATTGAQTVSVNYTDGNGCTAAAATVYNVTVNPLPVPTIAGPAAACVTSSGNVYTTEAGMTGYTWNVTGGTITAGAGTDAIIVTWNTVGAQTVSVNYDDPNGCTAASATVYNVTVNPLPVPTIAGPAAACVTSTGNVYTTEAGMTGYLWNVTGGTITAGLGTDAITVTWNTVGAQTVSVNYTNGNGCTAAAPTVYNVTVNPLPVPTIAGPASVCVTSTGNTYTTEGGMSNYVWNVSAGGTVTAGGTATSNTITVTWNTTGAQFVSVNYTNSNGCTAAAATVYNVTVNPLPVPTIAGPAPVCATSTGNVYTTEAGMTNYIWSVSAGGSITAGGTATSNTVTVTWNTPGAQTVSVNYTNANGCTAATATVYNVTVNPLPVPTITGPASVCVTSTGNVYSTETGMTGYNWNVTGGNITAGAGTNAITVTWNTTGAQTVTVNYINGNGCTATVPTVYNVTVNPLPVPTITGPTTACAPATGNIYTTQTGMTGYTWVVSAGGVITAGSGTNAITVTWNTVGAQTVSVNYTNANGCSAATPTVYNVTVNPRPNPTLTGIATVCAGTTGVVYTTDPGMTGYVWTVSAGGSITAGAGTNSITVTWITAGAQTVTVNYNNVFGCAASTPTSLAVTVNALPVPTITGPASACTGSTGNLYTTAAGMTNYVWTVSAGGTITAGGTSTSNTATITWNTAGAQFVTVTYTNANGCTAASPTQYNVTVNANPTPTITGQTSMCVNSGFYDYTTQPGMTNYVWTISAGGTITWGQGSNVAQVTWDAAGPQWIAVTYTNAGGCTATVPTQLAITVNPMPGTAGNIVGTPVVCGGAQGVAYSVGPIANAVTYVWSLPPGATIATGALTNSITVNFDAYAQSGNITVYGDNLCGSGPLSPPFAVTVNALPDTAGIIVGDPAVCAGTSGAIYTVAPINNATSYVWTVPAGATIVGGATTNTITVDFSVSAVSGMITVHGTNTCGAGATGPEFEVTVSPIPPAPIITQIGDSLLMSNIPTGNQWYFSGAPIPGATGQYLLATILPGEYWCVVTWNGCSSDTSVHIFLPTGIINTMPANASFNVFPVPNDGRFTATINYPTNEVFSIKVYNNLGVMIFEQDGIEVRGTSSTRIDLGTTPPGVYTVAFETGNKRIMKKILIRR